MKTIRFISCLLLAAFVLTGCYGPTHHPDPLAGWSFSSLNNLNSNKAIADDYKGYIRQIPPEESKRAGLISYFEDGTGQHAVRITVSYNGATRQHVLIYDKDNKRIKTIKYISSHDLML